MDELAAPTPAQRHPSAGVLAWPRPGPQGTPCYFRQDSILGTEHLVAGVIVERGREGGSKGGREGGRVGE